MKLFTLLLAGFMLVSCGKNEPLTNLKNVAVKATFDTLNTASKAVQDIARETENEVAENITTFNDMKNQLIENSDNFVNDLGKGTETVGQIPRNLINSALGTDSSTDDKAKNNAENIEDLEQYLEEIYTELLQDLSDLNAELNDFKLQVSIDNQDLQDAIDQSHTELLDEINRVDRKNLRKIRRVKRKLRILRREVRQLKSDINNLETYCNTYFQFYSYFPSLVTYCEIYID